MLSWELVILWGGCIILFSIGRVRKGMRRWGKGFFFKNN